MRKFYSALVVALFAASSALAVQPQLQKAEISEVPAVKLPLEKATLSQSTISKAPVAAETTSDDGEWVKKATGIWFEGPLATCFTGIDEGQWDVDIYENSSQPGVIRLNPYYEGTSIATLVGSANEVMLEINISNPEQCYFSSWSPFGVSYSFSTYCSENGDSTSVYGTIVDDVLTFEDGSIVLYYSGTRYIMGEMKIALDKTTYVDYTVTAEAPFCSEADSQYFTFSKTDAITTVKVYPVSGIYPMSDTNASVVSSYGEDVTEYADKKINFGFETGPNSVLYVGLDESGNIKDQGAVYTYIVDETTDGWTSLGNTTYTEGVLSSIFTDVESEDLTCEIQENDTIPGYFRLVNPYANHSKQFTVSHSHNHYIYINATDSAHVYMELSHIGAYVKNYGEIAAQSWGNIYLDDVSTGEKEEVWGTYADGEITIPQFLAQLSEYSDAEMLSVYDSSNPSVFAVKIPKAGGITDVKVDADSTEAVYYNLQGVRVAEPSTGVFIKVQGGKAAKIIK